MRYCGVLNIDKPSGMTSRDVVDLVVPLVRPAKVGHAGTLDPLATGVLVVCVGHATRLINLVQEGRKRYRARFVLGQRSDTDDMTGLITPGGEWSHLTKEHLAAALPEFIGRIQQVPPQFSAVHVQGQRAYKLARRGQAVVIEPRPVDVYSLQLTDFQPPEFELDIECGSGTYIRSIGRDLGTRLGCGALMTSLRRLTVDSFQVANSVTVDRLTSATLNQFLEPPLTVVSHFRRRELTNNEVVKIRCGQTIAAIVASRNPQQTIVETQASLFTDPRTALIGDGGLLLGIAELNETTNTLHPRIIFPDDDVESPPRERHMHTDVPSHRIDDDADPNCCV